MSMPSTAVRDEYLQSAMPICFCFPMSNSNSFLLHLPDHGANAMWSPAAIRVDFKEVYSTLYYYYFNIGIAIGISKSSIDFSIDLGKIKANAKG